MAAAADHEEFLMRKMEKDTQAIHADGKLAPMSGDIAPPIAMSTTFVKGNKHAYSRITHPQRERLEAVLACLFNETACFTFSAGPPVVGALMAAIKPKRTVLVQPTAEITAAFAGMLMLKQSVVSHDKETVFQDGDMVWLACDNKGVYPTVTLPSGSTVFVVRDVTAYPLCQYELASDSTPAAAVVLRNLESLPLSGCTEGAAVFFSDAKMVERCFMYRGSVGSIIPTLETWLLLRDLRCVPLHIRQQRHTTTSLLSALSASSALPPFVTAQQHSAVAVRLAFVEGEQAARFVSRLSLFVPEQSRHTPCVSWWSYHPLQQAAVNSAPILSSSPSSTEVVLFLGLETTEDVVADVQQALQAPRPSTLAFHVASTLTLAPLLPTPGFSGSSSLDDQRKCEIVLGTVLQGHAIVYPSGLTALQAAVIFSRARKVIFSGGYFGTQMNLDAMVNIGQIDSVVPLVDGMELSKDVVIVIETPNNPRCLVIDIAETATRAHAAGAFVVVDSTFAPPPLQFALSFSPDLVVHSATKFIGGHSDVLAGVLVTKDGHVAERLREERKVMGLIVGALELQLLARSAPTMALRVLQQTETATRLAGWFAAHPLVTKVWHPSLRSHPKHDVAVRQMPGGFGSVLSIELDSEEHASALPKHLLYFKNATSLGGVESLIEWRRGVDKNETPLLIRISVGVEAFDDLVADLTQAFAAITAPKKE